MGTWGWVYHDWRSQTTQAARLARLALHIAEVADRKDALSVSGAGMNASYSGLEQLLASLERQWEALDTKVRAATTGYRLNVRMQRP